jgi:hypothetical protein
MTPMLDRKNVGLLELLIDGFEKNEVLEGFHWRTLPMADAASAEAKFRSLVAEAERWKGTARTHEAAGRRMATWSDMEIRQSGRGILVRVKASGFERSWNDGATWEGDPLAPIYEWLHDERDS